MARTKQTERKNNDDKDGKRCQSSAYVCPECDRPMSTQQSLKWHCLRNHQHDIVTGEVATEDKLKEFDNLTKQWAKKSDNSGKE